jgi:NADPH:quinone reductase-like Zn-dependent oxidoreductase/aryl carrier-like protein
MPYLSDHRVQRAIIVPATAFVEMAFATARQVLGDSPCQIEDVQFANPCFLSPERPLRLHASFGSEDATVRIASHCIESDDDWIHHASAVVRSCAVEPSSDKRARAAIKQRCPRSFSGAECYAYFQKMGLDYGPLFQGIQRGWRGERESLVEVCLPEGARTAEDDYLFHPALLDACFQGVIPADKDFQQAIGVLYLPVGIEQVRLFRPAGRRLWSHARLREKTAGWTLADLDIYDESGDVVAQIRGLRGQRVAGGMGEEALDDLLYSYEWDLQARPEPDQLSTPGDWLLFADRGGVGERLAASLRARGQSCTLVFAGESFVQEAEDRLRIKPGSFEDTKRLLSVFTSSDRPALRGIVHLWNLDAPRAEEADAAALEAAQETGLLSVLHLVQAWETASSDQVARLILVTRGAQIVGDQKEVTPAQSPVIGLGRVIGNEYPRLRCRLVDLDPAGDDEGLLAELMATDDEDEIALRGGERFVHRYMAAKGECASSNAVAKDVPYRLTISRPGDLDGLTARAIGRPGRGPGEVEIEVIAAGLNFSDMMKALGIYPGLDDGPVPLGAECSGRITALGDGVKGLQIGDEVVAVAPSAFGSHVRTPAELVAPKPPQCSFEEAATLPIAFLTASHALDHLAHLSAGERVLIHSATGGVGLAAVQLARRAGAEIFATAGTAEKRASLRELGIAHVMDSRSLAFADEVMEQTGGRGVDVVLNSLAGEGLVRSLATLGDYGRFLEIGKRDVYGNSRLGLRPFRKNLSMHVIDLDRMIRERPAVLGSLLRQIVADVSAGRLKPLPQRVFPIGEAVAAFRHMQQSKHIGKVVLSMREAPAAVAPSEEPIAFAADATYLIAGGLGGFGLAVARWMVERGARHLMLLGRHGVPSPEVRQVLTDLEQQGARIEVRPADISKEGDVAAVLAEIDRNGPPLRGVMHTAMVLEDCLLLNLDRDRLRRVLAPKVVGAWNLHRQTLGRPLDFFVLFSSLASVLGHAGQANYAAANAFLDVLAWYRRSLGLPALTVNWGYLGEVGYLAQRPELGERLERQGVQSFTVQQALTLLERAMRRQAIQISVIRMDWARSRGLGVTGRVSPRFAHLQRQAQATMPSTPQGLPTFDAMRSGAPEERRGLLDALVRGKVARVLGTSADQLDVEKPLLNLGIDSLMAVELRNWVEQELRVSLPIMELMRSPSLAHLTDVLLEQLAAPEGTAITEGRKGHATPSAGAKPEELLAHIEELPGEEVDALLNILLAERDPDRSTSR